MKINEFNELESKIKKQDFNLSYKTINSVLFALSIFGNTASIFLAFFFISKVISGAVSESNTIIVMIVSIILLGGLELLKRDIFDKFSMEHLRHKSFIKQEVITLVLFSLILISFSFYSSLNGAKEFSSKSVQIEQEAKVVIAGYKDSLSATYDTKILEIEENNRTLKGKIDLKDKEQTELQSIMPLSFQQRQRVADLKSEKSILRDEISENNSKLAEIKNELLDKIKEQETELVSELDTKKGENSSNSFIFIILSTLIEFIILIGVYFNKYYSFRSYNEMKEKLDKDPNYQRWLVYNSVIDIIFLDDTKINDRVPSNRAIMEMCKTNGMILLPKDILEITKLLSSLKIIKVSGSARYFYKEKLMASETIKNYFNIS